MSNLATTLRWATLPEHSSLPHGWKLSPLLDMANFVAGQSPDSEFYNGQGVGLPFLQGNADFGGRYPVARVWTTQAPKKCQSGDTLVSVRAPVGEVNRADREYALGRGLGALSPTAIDADFLYHAMSRWRLCLMRVGQGTTFDAVTARHFGQMKVAVPVRLSEQRAIADILDAVDTAIERTRTAIEKAEMLRHALLQKLPTCGVNDCGVLRDPAAQPEQFEKSSVGLIPKGWTVHTLRNVGKWMSGGTPSKADWGYWQGSIPWVSPKDMKTFLLHDTIDHVSEQGVRDGSQLVDAGTVFIVVRGMILAHTFPVAVAMRPMAFNQDMKGIACNGLVSPMYLAYWFTAQARQMLTLTSETSHGTKRVDTRLIWRFPIAVPPLDEQERMVKLLEASDRQIEAYRNVEAKQQRLKRGLIQDLLTGKRRVPVNNAVDTKTMAQPQPA